MKYSSRALLMLFLTALSAVNTPLALASHSVSADPPGGVFNSTQFVTLTSSENSTIYYTVDGSEPSNSSSVYTSPIEIAVDTDLNFFAQATSDNHTTGVVTESYTIDVTPPVVISTNPAEGELVDISAVINVTFSREMNESSINFDTFKVENTEGLPYFGFTTYDPATNTTTFFPDFLEESFVYVVTLESDIEDVEGNKLQEDYVFTFTTGPDMDIKLFEHEPSGTVSLLGGGTFTITPDPFTQIGSLTVEDNQFPDSSPNDGDIFLNNIEFGSYVVSQTGVPSGFGNIFDNLTLTAHETLLLPRAEFLNRDLSIPITDFSSAIFSVVPSPDLTSDQFDLYSEHAQVGVFLGFEGGFFGADTVDAVGPHEIPAGTLETLTTLNSPEDTLRSVRFDISAPPGTVAEELFNSFLIPRYPDIDPSLNNVTFYFVPAYVIPYGDTGNNFMLTPSIGHIRPGMTLVLEQPSYIESAEAKVERVNMTLATTGNDVGFSFAVTDERPPGTPEPELDVKALFLEIDFVGDVDYSDPAAFESPPVIDILVNKTLAGFDELPDGCVDFRLLLFNEGTGEWDEISQLRDPTRDTEIQCGFTLSPEHFSKFAVGGVKGQTISTESDTERNRGGGGGSRSTAVTSTIAGDDIETSVNTQSGEVLVRFESVQDGGGQLKINSNELSAFEEFFDEVAFLSQDNDEHGMVRINGVDYATTGDVFDIDASSVKYDGTVHVTIPYDEGAVTAFGAESDVRFLHYNKDLGIWEDKTASVDEDANTVTGELDSLSPVTSAINLGGDQQLRNDNPEDNMMLRIMPTRPSFSLADAGTVTLTIDLNNERSVEQEYVLLVQFVDQNNVAQYIDWRHGSLAGTSNVAVSISWDDMEKGQYRAQVLVLTDLDSPYLLSEALYSDLSI